MGWRFVLYVTAVLWGLPATRADAQQWPTISENERALARPLVEPAADAEVMLWDVTITDTTTGVPSTVFNHYLRIKIFNDRGREAASKVDLRFGESQSIRDIKGRTTAPNGTVIELAEADVRERTMLEANGRKVRALSFVLPAVVPGAVLEYRWREIREGQLAHRLVLPFQRQIPVYLVRYHIKPAPVSGYTMRTHVFNATSPPEIVDEQGGYKLIQVRRVPAARAEPFMPHEVNVGAWMFLYYADRDAELPEQQFWEKWSKTQSEAVSGQLRANGDITKAALDATAGATSVTEKIDALMRFVRQRVPRIDTGKPNDSARDTLKRGTGTGEDVVVLFTALARAAGIEAHLARMPDREIFVAPPRLKQPYFLSRLATALKIGTSWTFVDAANEHAPGGQLRWQQEGTYALVLDGNEPAFLVVGTAPREASQARRTGTLRLLANGDLEGELAITYTGHFASRSREQGHSATLAERERLFTERLTTYLPRAAVSSYRVENLDDADKPYVVRFSLAVPGFAERTGTRLRLIGAVLPREVAPAFTTTSRTRPVHFPFAWSEEDALTIELPDGYEVEATNSPAPVTLQQDAGRLEARISVSGKTLTYRRSFALGRGSVVFPVETYPLLKTFFDGVRAADAGSVLLRRTGDANER